MLYILKGMGSTNITINACEVEYNINMKYFPRMSVSRKFANKVSITKFHPKILFIYLSSSFFFRI
eukprot:gene12915-8772_t